MAGSYSRRGTYRRYTDINDVQCVHVLESAHPKYTSWQGHSSAVLGSICEGGGYGEVGRLVRALARTISARYDMSLTLVIQALSSLQGASQGDKTSITVATPPSPAYPPQALFC